MQRTLFINITINPTIFIHLRFRNSRPLSSNTFLSIWESDLFLHQLRKLDIFTEFVVILLWATGPFFLVYANFEFGLSMHCVDVLIEIALIWDSLVYIISIFLFQICMIIIVIIKFYFSSDIILWNFSIL